MTLIRGHISKIAAACGLVMATALLITALPAEALAAGDSADWRPTFDLVMRWVNFLILFFVIVKFSRAPIKSFLENKKQEIADKIKALEAEKKKILRDIDASRQQLENSRERLEQLKKKILAEGEKNRQKIIDTAKNESKLMLAGAGQKVNSRIQKAADTLKAELVDLAASIALEKLPAEISEQDNRKFINLFLTEITEK